MRKILNPIHSVAGVVPMVASKSESNRALILQALAGSDCIKLDNVSTARDTETMQRLLASEDEVLDVLDAGTTMRFLTAYCFAARRAAVLTGTPRMQERPIRILVDALRELGAVVSYEKQEGFPPHRMDVSAQIASNVSVQGDVSSQYISALLLIGAFLPQGIQLELVGEVASRPYIDMTIALMDRVGLTVHGGENVLTVPPQIPSGGTLTIESDWSGAGYWYSFLALADEGELTLRHLRRDSLQGDRGIVERMERLGVTTEFVSDGIRLQKGPVADSFESDFTEIPDQAQTFAVLCAALGIPARLTGLKSLRIKETDRIAAIETELAKFGCRVEVIGDEEMKIPAGGLQVQGQEVSTYDDHRMAMAFAPLACLGCVAFDDADVVAKSYPTFWADLAGVAG